MKYLDLLEAVQNAGNKKSDLMFLITEISGLSKSELILNLKENVPKGILEKIKLAKKEYLVDNVPVQYIIGYTYFYGLKIHLTKDVLIPRSETEEVVEKVIELSKGFSNVGILDIGTGSGCIALALKANLANAHVSAIDISPKALEVAKRNADYHNLDIKLYENDLLENFKGEFDIIVSNPPYINPNEEIMDLVYDNEPHLALFSHENGLYHYRRILSKAKNVLSKDGVIVFEIAYNKKAEMISLAKNYFTKINVLKDIHNNNRIMIIR